MKQLNWKDLIGRLDRAWTGAALGLVTATALFVFPALLAYFGGTGALGVLVGLIGFLFLALVAALLAWLVKRLLALPSDLYVALLGGTLALLYMSIAPTLLDPTTRYVVILLAIVVVASLLGAVLWVLLRGGWKQSSTARRIVLVVGLILGLVGTVGGGAWLLSDGRTLPPPVNAAALAEADIPALTLPDPSQPGPHAVRTLTYGSGQDLLRPEYGADAALITLPVDGSRLIGGWSGLRRSAWGFGPEALPLNGRVWYPDPAQAGGPFPLTLIAHGNHIAEEYSDPGYAYLGELLASRGSIVVSVDENFLNDSPSADLGFVFHLTQEDDVRGWLLLEHLRAWKEWNETPGNLFYGQVDLERVALIGHSRGGEAVAIAAAFNQLPCYPDDANVTFDYHFGIRAVAAIAPIDWRYLPGGLPLPLENVSYFVLHGAQDMQTAFSGRRMFQRLRFTDGKFHFKSALFFYGGNHGQYNTVWGRKDIPEPGMRLYNERILMPAQEQRQIAQVYLAAFLETTLYGETGYLPLFCDARAGAGWLPDTIYLAQYSDSETRTVATFDDDIDLTTADLPGSTLQGRSLTVWREQCPRTRELSRLENRAVYLGWDAAQGVASYAWRLPDAGLGLDGQSVLVLTLGDAEEASNEQDKPIDLTVEVIDAQSNVARLPLSRYAFIQPRIPAHIFKAAWLSTRPNSEIVLQNFEFRLAEFAAANPSFDPAALIEVRLVFDRTGQGVIVLDDIGFR